jgi:glycine betaine/proline transport system substrate-binding protein
MARLGSALITAVIVLAYASISYSQMTPTTEKGACLGRPKPAGYGARNPVNIALNPWSSAVINAEIVRILLEEVIGIQTSLVAQDSAPVWEEIAQGRIHAAMEYWPSERQAEELKYLTEDRSVVAAGPLGIVGQVGWYVPKYVVNDIPQVLFGDFSPDVAAYFNNTFVLGDIDWGGPERRVINDFNFSLNVEVLGGEEDLALMLFERYAKQEPMLFYFWRPHPLHSVFDLMRITLPNDTMYYPPDILGKIMWPDLADYSPEAAFLVSSYAINNNIMTELLGMVYNNISVTQTACQWIQANEQIWTNWIRPSSYKEVGLDLQIAMWVLSGLCIICTVFYLAVIVKHRQSKVIIASSGVFLVSMCIGGIFMFGSVVAFVASNDVGCNLFIWMLPVGFALLFGSLFAKTGRIYLLFANKSLQIVKYTDRDVGFGVGIILLGECAILIAMMIIQPARYLFQNEGEAEFSFCTFHFPTGITLIVYNGVVLIFGIIISALVSRLRLTLYNESKYIAWAMYNFGFVVIFIAVIFLVTDVIVRFALLCCCVLFITMVSLSVLFVPKLRLLFRYSEEELRQMNEEQLQAVIRSYTKKFASSSGRKNSTKKGTTATTGTTGSYNGSVLQVGSSFEDEMAQLASNVKSMSDQIKDLKSENKRLKESSSGDYRDLYEKFYHENMILKNEVFELRGLLKKYQESDIKNSNK